MKFNTGKLYQIKQYYWLIYPTKDIAHSATTQVTATVAAATAAARYTATYYSDYWSKHYNCNISYISENNMFCLLEQDEKYLKVITSNGEICWMIYPTDNDWIKDCIEEVKL